MIWNKLADGFLSLLYPPLCCGCGRGLFMKEKVLCGDCFASFPFLNPRDHCRRCFLFSESPLCPRCKALPSRLMATAATCADEGAALALRRRFEQGDIALAEPIASLLFYTFSQLSWSSPDLLIPIPSSPLDIWDRGYCPADVLSHELGALLHLPSIPGFKRSLFTIPETNSHLPPLDLSNPKEPFLRGETVVLIDTLQMTGKTLRQAANLLHNKGAGKIYGLTLCRSLY